MPRTNWGFEATPQEVDSWILRNDSDLLVVDKPAHLVCHPSKRGPWSSLVGACRQRLGMDRLHMVSRLDRETSGVVVMAKSQELAGSLQSAMQSGGARKIYLAILEGQLEAPVVVEEPVGPDLHSEFVARQSVVPDGRPSKTGFVPQFSRGGFTMVEVRPFTGRRHQIRVHAAWIGKPIVGDKLYGPNPALMLRFISQGITPEMLRELRLDRHALHASEISFPDVLPGQTFSAPVAPELIEFWNSLDQ